MSNSPNAQLIKRYKKKLLFDIATCPSVSYKQNAIKTFIPHRAPLLFVDEITNVDIEQKIIAGRRWIDKRDPVFQGHFPDYPVYPGTSVIESVGQLALCLYQIVSQHTDHNDAAGSTMILTKIEDALFIRPVLPDTNLIMLGMALPENGMFYRAIGQAVVDGAVAVVVIAEILIT